MKFNQIFHENIDDLFFPGLLMCKHELIKNECEVLLRQKNLKYF
jgi:hypothetical protein